jgi:hypothetical protein
MDKQLLALRAEESALLRLLELKVEATVQA